jgi:prolyl 4-hydroxylase
MTAVDRAQRFLASGQTAQAVAELERAAIQGDASSWLDLGLLFLAGKHVQRDLARARDCFSRAGQGGNLVGKNIHLQLLALGAGGDSNWDAAVSELQDLGRTNQIAERQLALLEQMTVSPDGNPSQMIAGNQLSIEPEVWSFERFFSPDECSYLIARAQPLLQPSVVVDPATGELTPHPVRTSHNTSFPWVSEDLVIQALNRRIAKASATLPEAGEPLQILRYEAGQQYRPHFDAYDSMDNQRVWTMLVYLNEDYEGGETLFTHNGLMFRGPTGAGLLFRNATPSGARDENAQHAGLPVRRGEKWLARRWIREQSLVQS